MSEKDEIDRDTDEQMEEWLEENSQDQEDEVPSRAEMYRTLKDQQRVINSLQDRVSELEQQVEDLDWEEGRLDEVLGQLDRGELAGEAGADILMRLAPSTTVDNKTTARARQLYRKIVIEHRVDYWVKTSQVCSWLELDYNAVAHRVMDKLEDMTEADMLLGHIEQTKRNGQRAIRLTGTEPDGQKD